MMQPKFTNAGKELHARALAGIPLTFTKMMIGDGELGEADYRVFTGLVSPKATLPLARITAKDGVATVTGYFSNETTAEGFYYRELGLFARDPENPEPENDILYCYANFGDQGEYIAQPTAQYIERSIRIYEMIDDAANVSAVIDGSLAFITQEELREAIAEHNADIHAHPDLAGYDVTFYIDAASEEPEDDRDGSEDHPFISISEGVENIPLSALRVNFILVSGDIAYAGLPRNEWLTGFDLFHIRYSGSTGTRPHIDGYLHFSNCREVIVEKVRFQGGSSPTGSAPGSIELENVSRAELSYVKGSLLEDSAMFLIAKGSTVFVNNAQTEDAATSFLIYDGSIAYLTNVSISGGNTGLFASTGGQIHIMNGVTNTATAQQSVSDYGIIYNSDFANDVTTGAIHSHITDQSGNPHNVSLTQAQSKGGTISVGHGGTGRTSFDSGSILLGAGGTGQINQLLGSGALYSNSSGVPTFGTLPISAGGTGDTTIRNIIHNEQSYASAYGAYPGSYALPGSKQRISGTDYWIVLMFGRIRIDAGSSFSWDFQSNGNGNWSFIDENYVLVFSNDDIETSTITKTATGFSITSSAAGRAADFVAVGLAKERTQA